jgi:N-acetylmuramoyl-L-alanine amidase
VIGLAVALLAGGGAAVVIAATGAPSSREDRARSAAPTRARPAAIADARPSVGDARPAQAANVPEPKIVRRFIPFGAKRHREMVAYAKRHYGIGSDRLTDPHVIVEHYTDSADAQSAINTFTADTPDVELHELPGVCSHFVIDTDGTIYQLVALNQMCRHTVGLNYTSIGIEHAGFSDRQILNRPAQLRASLSLTRWLRCRFGVSIRNVIGHNESLSSPYHHERVARLRHQTHDDWKKADMDVYRRRLAKLGGC